MRNEQRRRYTVCLLLLTLPPLIVRKGLKDFLEYVKNKLHRTGGSIYCPEMGEIQHEDDQSGH